ncbi:Putative outer membrane protein [Croceitalea dokdonensis DOKDO 023]|uniref:Putative outer membrane protein n=1 Tax=Croceitalea dokdonensis DOKDO 023 TaxID=1300341 RepID=A0A0P7B1X4_9FLAO|nr:carboxypeptidase-like regulatory domain-containing protein [Croceitalea dokdonensis]KPM33227.1 Putative outer membrane protein [Croceitalea dokdonensis DOKDO 023]
MKKNVLLVLMICCCVGLTYSQQRTVKGKVTDGKNPIEDVVVKVVDKEAMVSTNNMGFYQIEVATGDVLQFAYMGMKTVKIRIEDVTNILNPILVPDITELDEVTVKKSNRKSQQDLADEYQTNSNIIRTAFGYLNSRTAPGAVRMLNAEAINPVNLCILDLLRGRFAAVEVGGDCIKQEGNVFIRGFGSLTSATPAIFDIDGLIVVETPFWLDVGNIKRLAILNNLANTTQYGSVGIGGVVVINTIAGNTAPKQVVDQARLRNNFYQGDALGGEKLRANWPTYKKELYASANLDEAKMVYQKYAPTYSNSPYFLMDAQAYFAEKGDNAYAEKVVADNGTLLEGNPVLLKALAYQYQAQGNHASANELYKEVFLLRPNYAQSYLDMANSYRDLGRAKQAAAIYARYEYLLQEGFMESDSITLAPMMDREFNNLLALQRDAVLDGKKRKSVYVAEDSFKGTRLVFEWNDGEAEFDLQFVNPEGQYSLWKHSLADNEALIGREKDFGYNMTEELIDGSLPGTWQVNVRYHGNKSLTPTYLKATVYHNYGEVSQRKEVKVFKLTLKDVNQELFRVQTTKGVVMR